MACRNLKCERKVVGRGKEIKNIPVFSLRLTYAMPIDEMPCMPCLFAVREMCACGDFQVDDVCVIHSSVWLAAGEDSLSS